METTTEQITAILVIVFLGLAIATTFLFSLGIQYFPTVRRLKMERQILAKLSFCYSFQVSGKTVENFLRAYVEDDVLFSNDADVKVKQHYSHFNLRRVFEVVSYPIEKISSIATSLQVNAFMIIITSFIALLKGLPEGKFTVNFEFFVKLAGSAPFQIVAITDVIIIILSVVRLQQEFKHIKSLIKGSPDPIL